MKRYHRGQAHALDLLLALGVFLLVIFLFQSGWEMALSSSVKPSEKMTTSLYNVVNTLFESGGYPSDWTEDNVLVIGLCDERNVVNPDKLEELLRLLNSNYTKAKELLGVAQYEIYVNVTSLDGELIYLDGMAGEGGLPPRGTAVSSRNVVVMSKTIRVNNSIIIMFDQSGSMNDVLPEGITKMEAAKQAAKEFLDTVDPKDEFALTTFRGCWNCYVAQPFTHDPNAVKLAIDSLEAWGRTPIARTLMMSADYMNSSAHYSNRVIILLSDGEETCDGNTSDAAYYANSKGVTAVHTVGFVLEPGSQGEIQLKEIAEITGGRYFPANSSSELKDAFQEAYQESTKEVVINVVIWEE